MTTKAELQKDNNKMRNILYLVCAGLVFIFFFQLILAMNLLEARKEVKAWEFSDKKQELKHSKKVKELNDAIDQLIKENEELSDMRPVHGVVSEY